MDLEPLLNVFGKSRKASCTPEAVLDNCSLIFECFRLHIDPSKLDEYLDQLFSDEDGRGIQHFLLQKLGVKSFNQGKEELLKLLKFILVNEQNHKGWKVMVFPFCHHFMAVAKLYWINSSEPAKHQQTALDILITIFANYGDQVDEIGFELPELYWKLLNSSEKTSFQPSVRGKIFHAMGMVASLTCGGLLGRDDYFQQLYAHIVRTMKREVESSDAKLEVAILQGCLKAMDKMLQSFSTKIDRDGQLWKQFYENLIQIVDPTCSIAKDGQRFQLKRREFQRAGLELVANNGGLFNKELFYRYKQWYLDLLSWSKSNNANDSSVGKRAMFTYLTVVCEYANTQAEVLDCDVLERFVSFFIQTFEAILSLETPRRNETIVAITGIGLISPLCNSTSKVGPVTDRIFDNVAKIVFELNNPIADKYSGSLSIVSTYLETISRLLLHAFEEDTEPTANLKFLDRLNLIEQLTVQFLTFYPQLSAHQKKSGHHCFLKIVSSLHSKHIHHCIPFIDRVLSAVLSQVIASPTTAELNILEDAWKANNENQSKPASKYPMELRGVLSYLGIWTNMANCKTQPVAAKLIYDRIVAWSLSAIDKLDLTMISDEDSDDQEKHPSDVFSNMAAVKPKDFQLLINLIEFLQKFLNNVEETMFKSWVTEFVSTIINHSVKNIFVSGFYKVLGTALEISGKLNFFVEDCEEKLKTEMQEKCSVYMKSVLNKMDTFRDDLLIAVLELWLSVPDEILVQNLGSWCFTLQKIFKMGRMYLPLADKSADALQRWMTLDSIPREVIEEIVVNLFPLWHSYFLAEGSQSPNGSVMTKAKPVKREEIELIRSTAEDDEALKKVQVKILMIIGSFAHVIDLENDHSVDISLDQHYNVLKFKIPFAQEASDMYLDLICPRVLKLCEDSVNRQVRTTACEFLHTMFLYLLGDCVRSNMAGQHQPIDLFRKMFGTIMKLSGDFDFLVRQLFNPLASQCIHWFTKQKTPYSDAILEMIVDGLVSDDTQLKDFSADCLYEYFKWALKHDNKLLAKDVLRFIIALSSHANSKFRLGACIAFNSIYRDFREDLILVNCYSIILITAFITSLSISRNVEEDSIIIKSNKTSVSHLERIIVKKKDNFNNNIGNRKKPPGFPGVSVQLQDLAHWLILQLGKPERVFREESSRLLLIIAPLVGGCGSVEAFLKSYYDGSTIIRAGERLCINTGCVEDLLSFLDAATQCYTFFSDHNSSVLQQPDSNFLSAVTKLLSISCELQQGHLKAIAKISLRLNKLESALTDVQRKDFHNFLIRISKLMICEEDMLSAIQILVQSQLNLSQDVITQLKHEFSYSEVEKVLLDSYVPRLRWLRLATESKLFEIIIDDAQIIVELTWNDLKRKLFSAIQANESQSTSVVEPNSQELEELLRMCLALGIDDEMLLDTAFDSQPFGVVSKSNTTAIPITKGEHFQKYLAHVMFQSTFLDFTKIAMNVKIETIGSYIEFLLRKMRSNKSIRQKSGQLLFNNVIKIWTPIAVNCDKYTVARILSGLIWLDLERCRDCHQLCQWWCGKEVMGRQNVDLCEMTEFLGFMGLFGLSSNSKIVESVINATEKVIQNNFPTSASLSSHKECITKLIQQIVGVFERVPTNLKMIELLSVCVLKISEFHTDGVEMNFLFKDISQRLLKFSQSGGDKNALDASYAILGTIMSAKEYNNNRNLFLHCLRPVLLGMRSSTFRSFFKEKINLLMDTLLNSAKTSALSIFQLNVDRIVYNLLSMIPKRYGSKLLVDLTTVYHQCQEKAGIPEPARKSILKVVSAAFLEIKKRKLSTSNDANSKLQETLLQCHCSAYSALAAILVVSENLPNHQKLMEVMLVHEDRSKTYLWENLIDCKKSVQDYFPVLIEPEDTPIDEEVVDSTDNKFNPGASTQSRKARINLAESSLAGESAVTFDFTQTGAATVPESSFYHRIFGYHTKSSDIDVDEISAHKTSKLTFNCTAFSLESIDGLVFTIMKLVRLSNSESSEVPKWIEYLKDVLMGSHHDNIKIFILAVMLNCVEELKPYTNIFIGPICKVILNIKMWKEPFNFFVKDVLVMLLDWSDIAVPSTIDSSFDPRQEICSFVVDNILAQDVKYSRNDLLETNLNLLDAIVVRWKIQTADLCKIPILDILRNDNPKVGILICKCIMKNNVLPIGDPSMLLRQFCSLLKNSSKPVYSDSAESLGLLLKFLENENYPDLEKATQYTSGKLKTERYRTSPFLTILQQIQKKFPRISSVFHDELLQMLGTCSSSSIDIINILFSSLLLQLENSENTFDAKTAVSSFVSNLNGRNVFNGSCKPEDTTLGISIFEEVVKYPDAHSPEILMKMVTWLNSLQDGLENVSLQSRYYKCISEIYSHCSLETADMDYILGVFSDALKHENLDIRNAVDTFWLTVLQDSQHPHELFVKLLELSGEKANSLEIILSRILQRCSLAPEFQKTIFDKPLEDCIFHDYNLDISWKTKQASFLPLFAESISSQQFSTIPQVLQASVMRQRLSVSNYGVNLLRASLSLRQQQFSLTQIQREDMSNDDSFDNFFPLSNFSEMEIDEPTSQKSTRALKNESNLSHLKKRFYNRPMDSNYFAARQVNLNAAKLNIMQEKLKSKQNMRVTRTYRIGEIPDIMIKHSDLLTTMFKLGQCDSKCGRLIVGQIFSTVFKDEEKNLNLNVTNAFDSILQNRKVAGTLAATIMDISIRNNICVSPNSVTSVSTQHHLYELGIIMLETRLKEEKLSEEQPGASKRRRLDLDKMQESVLLNVAELYSELDEVDVLKNIFVQISEKSNSKNFRNMLFGLNYESIGNFAEALEQYSELFQDVQKNSDIHESYSHFVETSYFKCLSKLSEWEKLMDIVGEPMADPIAKTNRYNWYSTRKCIAARAGLILTLEGESHKNLSNLEEFARQFEEDPELLVERALLLLCADFENTSRDALLLEQFWPRGITAFSNFCHLSHPQKNEQILQFQLASTLSDVLSWQRNLHDGNIEQKTTQLLSKFNKLIGNGSAPLRNSGMLISARSFFLKKLLHHDLLVDHQEFSQKMSLLNFQQHIWMLSMAVRDQIFMVSTKYLESSKTLGNDVLSSDYLSWRNAYISYMACFRESIDVTEWMEMWGSAWKKVRIGSSASQEIEGKHIIEMQSELLRCLVGSVSEDQIANSVYPRVNSAIGIGSGASILKAVEVGTKKLFDFVKQSQSEDNLNPNANLQLYQLLEELLRRFPDKYSNDINTLTLLLESLLRSMCTESEESVLLFPRLLDLIKTFHQLHVPFLALWTIVPTWKFLPWLDQIMTTYDHDQVMHQLLEPILQKIAKMYPDALRLQYEQILPNTGSHYADYVSSLKALVLPTIVHRAALDDILSQISKKNVTALHDTLIKFRQTLQEILDHRNIYGSLHLHFAEEVLGVITRYLSSMDPDFPFAFLVNLKQGIEAIRVSHEKTIFHEGSGSVKIKKLEEFTPWLAKFHQIQTNEILKFPGLFDQLSMPDIDSHPNIVSFNPTVEIYRSLTFPIRMTIMGNDGKRRSFLAKYGDDLRQDRRIQQVFRVTNSFFAKNSQIHQRKINIITYSAIPITASFGIIEWLDKTSKVSSFIANTKHLEAQQNLAAGSHIEWIKKTSGLRPPTPLYLLYAGAAKNSTRQYAERHFDSLIATTPASLLSDHLMDRCRSYEQFFKVRQNFVRSYAAMCLVHWLLGIGDRHLQNSLLSLETGKVIGIDFGRAFEVCNNAQAIPEMIPFRLGPNFCHLMMPYGYKGLFRETMCISWRCLLGWSDTIMFIINAFVNEHNIKWTTTKKGSIMASENVPEHPTEWIPMQTIKRKLSCKNPTNILLKTLESNPWKDIVPIYCDIVKNNRKISANDDNMTLSHEQVIDSLLDLATDKNILARLYVGLQAWI